ncbi:MAG: efflux RND transporter periplasmic adaptor subunit [Pirellula sp.]|jgi:RND family efflux transporter MFP subunit|nr:efflux RND transporter periplasmic adaptor subunit [Pirellula sp.]
MNPLKNRWLSWISRSGKMLLLFASIAGVGLLLVALSGKFQRKVDALASASKSNLPSDAQIFEVRESLQPRFETAVGVIKPVRESNLASKILARVLEVNVTAGKEVTEGDVLVRLNSEEQVSRVRQAESELDSALARLQLASIEANRASQLIATRSISQAEFDTTQSALKTAQALADRASRVVEETKVYLDYGIVRAPYTGIVVDKAVNPGDTVIPGQTLLTIYEPGNMQLVANVRESLALNLRVGQSITAKLESLEHQCTATISEVVPKADASSHSFEVKATGPCPPGIYAGMFGRLYIPLEDEKVILIPSNAVQRVGQLTLAQVAQGDRSVRRSIQTGRVYGDFIEVLAGLVPGERVILPTTATRGEP